MPLPSPVAYTNCPSGLTAMAMCGSRAQFWWKPVHRFDPSEVSYAVTSMPSPMLVHWPTRRVATKSVDPSGLTASASHGTTSDVVSMTYICSPVEASYATVVAPFPGLEPFTKTFEPSGETASEYAPEGGAAACDATQSRLPVAAS